MSTRNILTLALAAFTPIVYCFRTTQAHGHPKPTTTITSCSSSTIEYPTVASGFNLHHVCGTHCTAEYPLCQCVQYSLDSWYCGPDPYDTAASTNYGCCQDWGNGKYGCFCDGTPGA